MDKNKKITLGVFVGAICFYIEAAISFLNRGSSNTMGIMFLCLGSSLVAIGGSIANKHKNKDNDNSSNNYGE
ncbi:hypothetical protein HK225_02480 [Streptococcus agalactiae]|nr:hypothetical protein [Streptococcus agalactiae]